MAGFNQEAKIAIFAIAVGIVIPILTPYIHFPFQWAIIISAIIIAGSLFVIFSPNIKKKQHGTRPPSNPVLTYGRIIVRGTTNPQHRGVYRRSTYFVEVVNNTANTTARNCRGSITLLGSHIINRRTVWENNNRESIDIGHREYLYLFKVETFRTQEGPESTRLYFTRPTDIDFVDEESRDTYNENLDRRLNVLIHSDNAHFPTEANSFSRTVRQIINDALEE